MKNLNNKNIEIVRAGLDGKRLEKFNKSIECIVTSLAVDGWLPHCSRSALVGFNGLFSGRSLNQGFDRDYNHPESDAIFASYMLACHSSAGADPKLVVKHFKKYLTEKQFNSYSEEFYVAYAELRNECAKAVDYLNSLRPLPVITEIGLSPRTTTTIKEMNLDLDMASIQYPEIDKKLVHARSLETGELLYDREKNPVMVWHYFIVWPKDTMHDQSRFAHHHQNCHACGKYIPSNRFVPLQAVDKNSGRHISMWLGQDCARKIFGVKDEGFENKGEEVK
jgi:hypothetical protein